MYIIKKADYKITNIEDKAWESANVAKVEQVNWKEFDCYPKMETRILYSDFGIHIKLTTDEKNLVASQREQNSPVSDDSCMEFFFRPNENDPHYFNFEFNPFGTMYMAVRTSRYDSYHPAEDKKYFGVVSEVGADEWSVMFSVPFEIIDRELGGHTKKMYGNIQKCGGEKNHYLSYYPIGTEKPDFHRSEYFGPFELE